MITVVLWVLQCYLLCCCVAAAIDDKSLGWCRLWFRVGLFLLALNRGLRTCIDVIIQLLQTLSSCYCVASLIFYPHDSSVEQIDLMCIFFTIDNNIYDFTVSEWERVNRNRRIWQVSILCEFGKPMLQTLGAGGSLANHVRQICLRFTGQLWIWVQAEVYCVMIISYVGKGFLPAGRALRVRPADYFAFSASVCICIIISMAASANWH